MAFGYYDPQVELWRKQVEAAKYGKHSVANAIRVEGRIMVVNGTGDPDYVGVHRSPPETIRRFYRIEKLMDITGRVREVLTVEDWPTQTITVMGGEGYFMAESVRLSSGAMEYAPYFNVRRCYRSCCFTGENEMAVMDQFQLEGEWSGT